MTTDPRTAVRAVALGLVLALGLVACGQKPGVHVEDDREVIEELLAGRLEPTGSPEGGTGTPQGTAPTAAGTPTGPATPSPGNQATGTGTAAPTGDGSDTTQASGGDGDGGQAAGQQSGQQQTAAAPGSDRTGAEEGQPLTLGIHAPVTGAAPLPAPSFKQAKDLYWRWQIEQKGRSILGHDTVEVVFRDDKYNPSSAAQVCREMKDEAFLLVGGGGTDQIQTCGRLAGSAGFPYFSAGVTEAGLTGNPWYFAASMTYRQQGLLLAQYISKRFGNRKVGAIITDTANFDDAVEGFRQGVQRSGVNLVELRRHPKGDNSWKTTYVNDFAGAGIEVVYMLTAPTDYIEFANQGADQGYNPQYVGVGVSMGLNAVLSGGCGSAGEGVDNGTFFSPFPGLDWARDNVPEFFQAAQRFGTPSDDLALALWGIAEQTDVLFRRYQQTFGNDLTREAFRGLVEQQDRVATSVFPLVSYSPDDHFGGRQVHVLEANCSTEQYETVATFASGF